MFDRVSVLIARQSLAALLLALLAFPAFAQTIDTYAGGGTETADGVARGQLALDQLGAIAVDADGVLYVATEGRIRKFPNDVPVTIAGDGTPGFSGDGGPATAARIGTVTGIDFGSDGSLYFTDSAFHRVRKIAPDGTITTIAGNGDNVDGPDSGGTDDEPDGVTALSTALGTPKGLALDTQGVVFVTTFHRIRSIQPDGRIFGFSGSSEGYSGDMAFMGRYTDPHALVNDRDDLYIADRGNNRVRHIDQYHNLILAVGEPLVLPDGSAQDTTVRDVSGLALDLYRQIYMAQGIEHRVIRADIDRVHSVLAGTGVAGFSGDGGPAAQAQLSSPGSIVIGKDRTLYIADRGNGRVRRIVLPESAFPRYPTPPPPPLVEMGFEEAYLRLSPPEFEGASPITRYTVEGFISGPTEIDVDDVDAGGTIMFRLVKGLSIGQTYRFTVTATNANGTSLRSRYSVSAKSRGAVYLSLPQSLKVVEGDSGVREATITATLSKAVPRDVQFDVATAPQQGAYDPTPGVDYEAVPKTTLTIRAGQRSVSQTIRVFGDTEDEYSEFINLEISDVRSEVRTSQGTGWVRIEIVDDDVAPPPPPRPELRDDRYDLLENTSAQEFEVLANDGFEVSDLVGGLTIMEPPSLGQVEALGSGALRYVPDADTAGEDVFSYRLCYATACSEATVTVMLRPVAPMNLQVETQSGFRDIDVTWQRQRRGASFQATPLVEPSTYMEVLDPNGSLSPTLEIEAPADGRAREWRILIDARAGDAAGRVDVVAAVEQGDNYEPAPEEVRCVAEMGRSAERCEMTIAQAGDQAVRYYVMARLRSGSSSPVWLDVFQIPMEPSNGSLMATGAGIIDRDETSPLRIGWEDPTLLTGRSRAGYVRVKDGSGDSGEFPVRIDAVVGGMTPVLLLPGVPRDIMLAPGGVHDLTYIDVPEGATRLKVESTGYFNVDLYLARHPTSAPVTVGIAPAPPIATAQASASSRIGGETLEIGPGVLTPGRWYVITKNSQPGNGTARVRLLATLEGVAPVVRPGSYFNAARSGHGLFLYPAGNELAGLWYTYFQDGSPTWYYLQGLAPGANGVWKGTIYRGAWSGSSNQLAVVGRALASPSGPDAFTFSFMLDGESGSEPMAALGRGCPSPGGIAQDASSHWFDPATAGTGYSVQMFPDYEFYAAFVYDAQGRPRFLLGEGNGFAGSQGNLGLEQMSGFCPTCARTGDPVRSPVGVMSRTFTNGALTNISVDAVFADGIPGAWTGSDTVQPLGGPGTTQGCGL